MSVSTAGWRAIDPASCACHAFPEGLAVFRESDKSTFYLPHPAGELLSVLREQARELELDEIRALMQEHLQAPTLEAVLVELEQLQLVERAQ